jgi:HD-GYP domain-containing protein (c-di-GMP phosphodiesterase class II)
MVRLSDVVRGKPQAVTPPTEGHSARSRLMAQTAPADAPSQIATDASSALTVEGATGHSLESESARGVLQLTLDLIEEIDGAVKAQARFPLATVEAVVEILLQSVESSDALLLLFSNGRDASPSRARRAANVCILSLRMGVALGYAPMQLRGLGVAALLCDAWKSRVPVQIVRKRNGLTTDERAVLETHQREAVAVVQNLAPEHPWLVEVARARYETPETQPNPKTRAEEYAAIMSLADTYERLVHRRAPRDRSGPLDTLQELLKQERGNFPDRLLKALVLDVSTFPIGSLVRLNTGEIGRVVTRNKDFPLRPVVEILVRQGKTLETPAKIDLSEHPLCRIEGPAVEPARP